MEIDDESAPIFDTNFGSSQFLFQTSPQYGGDVTDRQQRRPPLTDRQSSALAGGVTTLAVLQNLD
jgi:hypothetical protein